jgi:hypothetical protein
VLGPHAGGGQGYAGEGMIEVRPAAYLLSSEEFAARLYSCQSPFPLVQGPPPGLQPTNPVAGGSGQQPQQAPEEYMGVGTMIPIPPRPRRPAEGRVGKPVALTANWFKIECKADELYQYTVEVVKSGEGEGGGGRGGVPQGEALLPSKICRMGLTKLAEDMK